MFQVRAKLGENTLLVPSRVYTVYSIRDGSDGYPQFLVYASGKWLWKSAKYFTEINQGE